MCKIMNTQIQNLLRIGRAALPRHRATSGSFKPTFILLALLGLAVLPGLKAQELDFSQNLNDFKQFFPTQDGTNNIDDDNLGGAAAMAELGYAIAGWGKIISHNLKTPVKGGSSSAGTLFGTASLGGSWGHGTVFALNTDGTGFTVLHDFTGSDGAFPTAGLILSSNTLYGTTVNGGNVDDGTVFALDTNGTNFTVLHHFTTRYHAPYTNSDGGNPHAALILSGHTLYGTALDGGSGNAGTVFSLNINNTNFTVLHSFTAAHYDANFNLTNSDGANPYGRLLLSGDMLYGTASGGGTGGAGTVFAVNINGTNFTVLHDFAAVDPFTLTNSDGVSPQAGLILSGDTLYGTAFRGGNSTLGTVFAVNTNGTFFTNLYSFTGGSDGAKPAGELVLSTNTLFGTASAGGDTSLNNGGNGTVFALNTNGTGFTVVYRFTAGNYDYSLNGNNLTNSYGANPQAGLVFSGNTLYGTTEYGGSGGNGTVFSLSPAPPLTILGVTLSGTNLVINGANGQSGETNVTLMTSDLLQPLSQWKPVATNILNVTGDFTFTATNAVDPKAPRRFYILQLQ
jgi:uncharacterized repeat protein (TIGR03803 family)